MTSRNDKMDVDSRSPAALALNRSMVESLVRVGELITKELHTVNDEGKATFCGYFRGLFAKPPDAVMQSLAAISGAYHTASVDGIGGKEGEASGAASDDGVGGKEGEASGAPRQGEKEMVDVQANGQQPPIPTPSQAPKRKRHPSLNDESSSEGSGSATEEDAQPRPKRTKPTTLQTTTSGRPLRAATKPIGTYTGTTATKRGGKRNANPATPKKKRQYRGPNQVAIEDAKGLDLGKALRIPDLDVLHRKCENAIQRASNDSAQQTQPETLEESKQQATTLLIPNLLLSCGPRVCQVLEMMSNRETQSTSLAAEEALELMSNKETQSTSLAAEKAPMPDADSAKRDLYKSAPDEIQTLLRLMFNENAASVQIQLAEPLRLHRIYSMDRMYKNLVKEHKQDRKKEKPLSQWIRKVLPAKKQTLLGALKELGALPSKQQASRNHAIATFADMCGGEAVFLLVGNGSLTNIVAKSVHKKHIESLARALEKEFEGIKKLVEVVDTYLWQPLLRNNFNMGIDYDLQITNFCEALDNSGLEGLSATIRQRNISSPSLPKRLLAKEDSESDSDVSDVGRAMEGSVEDRGDLANLTSDLNRRLRVDDKPHDGADEDDQDAENDEHVEDRVDDAAEESQSADKDADADMHVEGMDAAAETESNAEGAATQTKVDDEQDESPMDLDLDTPTASRGMDDEGEFDIDNELVDMTSPATPLAPPSVADEGLLTDDEDDELGAS